MIQDAILTCKKRGVDEKAIRLWYKLNEKNKIRVKTGVGKSEFAEVGAVLGQGTLGGALISQAVLDDGIMEHFYPGEEGQPIYGTVPLAPTLFQDDLANGADGILQARLSSAKINLMIKQRGLRLNEDKSVCLIFGSKNQKQIASSILNLNPLKCGQTKISEVTVSKYLGQYLSSAGLSDCVEQTVLAREGKIRGACLEVAQIVNDWRSEVAGGMETALLLWEACCVPSLLHGAGTWVEITPAVEKRLNNLQQHFLRLIYQVGPGAPIASLGWDTATLDMGLRIWREKVMLIIHIRSLEEETLAQRVYTNQRSLGWPGLAAESERICQDLGIESCNTTSLPKGEYRKVVTKACDRKNEEKLRSLSDGKTKCERMNNETYGKKDYISQEKIEDVRKWYKTRFGLQKFAGNYSKDRRFAKTKWLCRCGEKEKESHLKSENCPIYSDIREKYGDFSQDIDLVNYFTEVLHRRDLLDDLEAEERNLEL